MCAGCEILRFHGHTQGENSAAGENLRNVMLSVGGETMKILCFGRTFFKVPKLCF